MRQKIKQKLDYVSVREMRRIDARTVTICEQYLERDPRQERRS